MPVYTYRREDGTTFDIRQSFSDDPLVVDPNSGQKVQRVIHASGIIFKGSGFYVTDNRDAARPPTTANGNGSSNGASSENGNGSSNGASSENSNGASNGSSNGASAKAKAEPVAAPTTSASTDA